MSKSKYEKGSFAVMSLDKAETDRKARAAGYEDTIEYINDVFDQVVEKLLEKNNEQ